MPAQKQAAQTANTPVQQDVSTGGQSGRASDAPPAAPGQSAEARRPFGEIFGELWREQRQQGIFFHRGIFKQQRQLMGMERSRALLRSTLASAKAAYEQSPRVPGAKMSFEEAVRKHRLTDAHLVTMSDRYKALQVAFYFLAIVALAYAWYLALGPTLLSAVPALATSVALAVYGYINAFRAWQIKHRSLISFEQALSIPSTYFVL